MEGEDGAFVQTETMAGHGNAAGAMHTQHRSQHPTSMADSWCRTTTDGLEHATLGLNGTYKCGKIEAVSPNGTGKTENESASLNDSISDMDLELRSNSTLSERKKEAHSTTFPNHGLDGNDPVVTDKIDPFLNAGDDILILYN